MESVVAVSHYEDGALREVRLYPIELGINAPDSKLGIPRMAKESHAQLILERVASLSNQWGTTIEVEGSVGVIRVE